MPILSILGLIVFYIISFIVIAFSSEVPIWPTAFIGAAVMTIGFAYIALVFAVCTFIFGPVGPIPAVVIIFLSMVYLGKYFSENDPNMDENPDNIEFVERDSQTSPIVVDE